MADAVDRILMRYQSQGFDGVIKEQQQLAQQYDRTTKAQDKVNKSSQNLGGKLQKLETFGRNLRQAGGFLGNDTIMALGSFADGLSDVGTSIDAVAKKGGGLGKVVAGLGAVVGGIGVGASIYDATIGKLQGTNTETILNQMRQLIEAGFNVDTLKVQAQQAFIEAQKGEEFSALQKQLSDVGKSRLDLAAQMGIYTGPRDEAGMRAALKLTENYLKTAPEWKPAAPGEKEQINYKLQAVIIAAGIREELGRMSYERANIAAVQNRDTRSGTFLSAGANLLQAGQTLGARQFGAQNQYQSALYNIEQETGRKRAEIARTFSQQTIQIDQDYYAARQKAAEDYAVATQQAQADFARQQQQAAKDYAKQQRRASEDHQDRLKHLIESRDALAVEDEMEAYKKESQRAEQDYNDTQQQAAEEFAIAQQQREADFANQLREMDRAHQDQKNERQRAYQEQLNDLALQAQQRRQMEAAQYTLLLRDILQTFTDARNAWATAVGGTTNNTTNNSSNRTNNVSINGSNMNKSDIYDVLVDVLR